MWRVKWPPGVVNKLKIFDNISISVGEAAGLLLQQMALEHDVEELHCKKALPFCDNTPAVSWVMRMTSRRSQVGGRMSKGIAMCAKSQEVCLLEAFGIEGKQNDMADVASQSFNLTRDFLFSDSELLTHINVHYPLPQNRSWRLVTLPHKDICKAVSMLQGQRLTMAQWTSQGGGSIGKTGAHSPDSGVSLHSWMDAPDHCKKSSFKPLLLGSTKVTMAAATELLRSRLTKQPVPWGRPSNRMDGKSQPKLLTAMSESFHSAGRL